MRPCIWDRLWLKFQDAFRQVPPLNLDLRGSPWGSSVGTKWVITWSPWKIWRRRLEHFDRSNDPVKMALTPGLRRLQEASKYGNFGASSSRQPLGPPGFQMRPKPAQGSLSGQPLGPRASDVAVPGSSLLAHTPNVKSDKPLDLYRKNVLPPSTCPQQSPNWRFCLVPIFWGTKMEVLAEAPQHQPEHFTCKKW